MKKLFRKRVRDYNSDNDDDERDVSSDDESEKEEEEAEDMDVNGDNGVSDDEENGKIQPSITMFLEGSSVRDRAPYLFYMMLGQTHVNG